MRKTALIIFALLALGLAAGWWWSDQHRAVADAPVPADYNSLDPQVALAVRTARGEIKNNPRDAGKRSTLAMLYHANGMTDLAEMCYGQAIDLDRRNARLWYRLALAQSDRGEVQSALASIEKSIELDSKYAPSNWRKGFWLLDVGRTDEAEAAFTKAAKLDARDPAPAVGLARVMIERGQYAHAVTQLQAVPHYDDRSDEPYVRVLLGTALSRQGKNAEAQPLLGATGHSKPRWRDAWADAINEQRIGYVITMERLQRTIEAGHYQPAITELQGILRVKPDNVEALNHLGLAYLNSKQLDLAIQTFQKALAASPNHYNTHINLASAYENNKDLARSAQHARLAAQISPGLSPAHVQLGRLSVMNKQYPEAADALDKALRCGSTDPDTHIMYGNVLLQLKRFEQAAKVFNQLLLVAPINAGAMVGLGRAQAEMGQFALAVQTLNMAQQTDPKAAQLNAAMARLKELQAQAQTQVVPGR